MELWSPIATGVMGYGAQWLRGIKKIPNALTDVILVVLAILLYFMGCDCRYTWTREFFIGLLSAVTVYVTSSRGFAAGFKEMGIAPRTDSL